MRANLKNLKDKRQLESILLICVLVATSIVIIVPLTAPKAEAVTHLISAFDEGFSSLSQKVKLLKDFCFPSDVLSLKAS